MRECGSLTTPALPPSFEGEHVQDAQTIILEVRRLIDECIDDGVCAIGLSGQMHGIVCLDDKGQAVSPLYTRQDQRGKQHANALGIGVGFGHATHAYNDEQGLVPVAVGAALYAAVSAGVFVDANAATAFLNAAYKPNGTIIP